MLATSCRRAPEGAPPPVDEPELVLESMEHRPPTPQELRLAAGRDLQRAHVYTAEGDLRGDPGVQLAPILLQEIAPDVDGETPGPDAPLGPRLVVHESTLEWRGVPYRQLGYRWRYRVDRDGAAPDADSDLDSGSAGAWRVVRFTLGASGHVAVVECFSSDRPDDAPAVVFVARSVEERARAEHGPPVEDGVFACERDRSTVVPALFEDGNFALGPFLYLSRDEREVLRVVCRCSPATVRETPLSLKFELESSEAPFEEIPAPGVLAERLRLPSEL